MKVKSVGSCSFTLGPNSEKWAMETCQGVSGSLIILIKHVQVHNHIHIRPINIQLVISAYC